MTEAGLYYIQDKYDIIMSKLDQGKRQLHRFRLPYKTLALAIIVLGYAGLQVSAKAYHRPISEKEKAHAFIKVADPIKVTGKITDEDGNALIGVTVKAKEGGSGTVTDADGNYTLQVEDDGVLVISYVGYETKEVPVNGRPEINIELSGSISQLNQLVVVGYGKQKKADLTGSVASVGSKELENRPVTNVSTALSGLAPGMSVRQGSGDPRSDGASIHIRGVGTLNNSSPLVIIDGIKGSMDAVNPNDIANISVLKDAASAAIYGAQAANGVILITTKKGKKGAPKVSYSGIVSTVEPINYPNFVTDYAKHMKLINEGRSNVSQTPIFTKNTIKEWEEASKDPNGKNADGIPNWLAYPNTDWAHTLFEHNIVQNHNLSVNGGGDNVRYMLSMGYLNNPGTMSYTASERYQLRANVEADVGKHITVGTQTFASKRRNQLGNTDQDQKLGITQKHEPI